MVVAEQEPAPLDIPSSAKDMQLQVLVMHANTHTHTHTVYIQYCWQGKHQKYDHIRCKYIRFWPTQVRRFGSIRL